MGHFGRLFFYGQSTSFGNYVKVLLKSLFAGGEMPMECFLINHVIEEQCIEDIINITEKYLTENINEFGEYSYLVDSPEEIELISTDIKFVGVSKIDKDKFDLKVKVETIVFTAMRMPNGELESDEIAPSFIISMTAYLNDRNFEFSIDDIEVGDEILWDKKNAVSPYLVPYLYVEDMDTLAEEFLAEYYPEALEKMIPIDPITIAERMGLKLKEARLTQSGSIFGQIFFEDGATTYYNPDTDNYEREYIDSGTILYDPEIFFMRSLGSVNNTIIHECLHWFLHKPFMDLQNLYINQKNISCLVDESKKNVKEKSQYEWLEWQCSHLAPRILMPAKWVKSLIENLYDRYEYKNEQADKPAIVARVIQEIADYFNVSKLSVKIRMLDLGYQEAEGVLNYVDSKYLVNFDSENFIFRKGETFIISDAAALRLYEKNITLRKLIDERKLIYIENKICINLPKYIEGFGEQISLTDYARARPEECCITIVQRKEKNRKVGMHYYHKTVLFSSAIINEMVYADADLDSEHNKKILRQMADTIDTMDEVAEIIESLPRTFHDTLAAHMKRKGCTVLKLVSEAHVYKQKITDMRNNPNARWNLEEVLAVCIGLHLHPEFIFDMLEKAKVDIKYNSKENIFYRGMIHQHYKASIEVWNEKLKERGYPLLGTEFK